MERRTKIVATISDRRCEVDFIASLHEAGMNVARINSAHVTTESADRIVDNIRKVSDKIAIIIDTKGPEIRTTAMDEAHSGGIAMKAGDIVNVAGTADKTPSSPSLVYFNNPTLYDKVPVGAVILIDDGALAMTVVDKKDGVLRCLVANSGVIASRKSVNIPGLGLDLPSVTERDREFIEWAIRRDIDFIAHSFVRSAADVRAVKDIVDRHGSPIKVISKIENREGVNNIDEILVETYGVMVARGDLGVEIPAEELPVIQRTLVSKCIASRSPVIIATQMLQSMIDNPRPTRAEVSDIANAVYQRVDAVMLSGETASGNYPVESVETMGRVALAVENDPTNLPSIDVNQVKINNEIVAQLARSAVRASINLPVKAIVADTTTGRTGRYLAAFRGQNPVFAMCYTENAMRTLALSYGVRPMYCEPSHDHTSFLRNALGTLEVNAYLNKEDIIVVMGGDFGVSSGASFIEIATVNQLQNKVKSFMN